MLFRKRCSEVEPVGPDSLALFRLGYQCNNQCRMCSNPAPLESESPSSEELLRRTAFLHDAGFRQVVLTGGEPTKHAGFWSVVDRLGELGMTWDLNTNGRTLSDASRCRDAVSGGMRRAIVSLHSHRRDVTEAITGQRDAQSEAERAIDHLLRREVPVLLNAVILTATYRSIAEYLRYCAMRFGRQTAVKLAFPSSSGRGRDWEGIQLRYSDVRAPLEEAAAAAADAGLSLYCESIPHCILGDATALDMGRSGFGETHYLDDQTGDSLHSIRYIESRWNVYGDACRGCTALARCPGIPLTYAREHGTNEFTPRPSVMTTAASSPQD